MESEEITKLVDGIYKNILDKFNPGTRQMINAGKAYLKALHGAAAASRVYVDAITKLARQAQQATWLGCSDIGSALMQIVEVYKETQTQQMNILKAFYVDVLVPLETNLEKDTKVVQTEQKRFLQQHKQHIESYTKAEANVKKYKKKQGRGNKNMDKELKSMHALEEEKNKLNEFCEQSLKHAMTQERRRYGFVLERQTSLAKHNLAFYEKQQVLVEKYMNSWTDIVKAREQIPESVENMFTTNLRQLNFYPVDQPERLDSPDDEDVVSINSQLRKARSIDSSGVENLPATREMSPEPKPMPLAKAKSEYNINDSTLSLHRSEDCNTLKPKPPPAEWEDKCLVRALFSYLSNGENQLSFLKGDLISVIGDRNKGWQYGENLRTKFSGWFPMAYTEVVSTPDESVTNSPRRYRKESFSVKNGEMYGVPENGDIPENMEKLGAKYLSNKTPVHKFGDSVVQRHHQNQGRRVADSPFNAVPPPVMPAPIVPVPNHERDSRSSPPQPVNGKKAQNGNASLHSSNDSGFSNDPPPAPDVDYSDDEINSRSQAYAKKSPEKVSKGNSGAGSAANAKKKEYSSSINDWLNDDIRNGGGGGEYGSSTLYSKRRHAPMRQSSSVGHLVTLGRMSSHAQSEKDLNLNNYHDNKKIKRTKSLWKFKKVDDVLEGMSLWKHRSLVDVNASQEAANHFNRGTPVLDKRMAVTREISVDSGDENSSTIMNGGGAGCDNVSNAGTHGMRTTKSKPPLSTSMKMMSFDNGRGAIDSEGESDPESCIVVDDHRKTDSIKMNSSSKLPRTRLAKANSSVSGKVENGYIDYKDAADSDMIFESNKLQTFKYNRVADRSWYDSWGERRKKL